MSGGSIAQGFAVDANDYWTDTTAFGADCAVWRSLGTDHILLLSGSIFRVDGLLSVADTEAIQVAVGGQEEVQPFLSGAGPDTQAEADAAVAPVAAILATHPSVEAVLIDDEPFPERISRLQKVVDAYRRLLPGIPVLCTMIGLDRCGPIQTAVGFDLTSLTTYPCSEAAPTVLSMDAFGYEGLTMADYVRQCQREMGVTSELLAEQRPPLWLTLQAHGSAAYGLTQPTPAQITAQYEEARKLGASRVYWFNWLTQVIRNPDGTVAGTRWTGVKDLPEIQQAIAECDGWLGVPDLPIDYSLSVDEWWSAHPFNVESPNYKPKIKHPLPWLDVDDYGGNLWQAIQALPADGGTVLLGTSNFSASEVYNGTFPGLAKNNVHIIAKPGASPVLTGILRLIPCHEARDYTTWSQMLAWNQMTNTGYTAREVVRDHQISGWYLGPGITYDGLGGTQNISFSTARNMLVDGPSEYINIVHPGGTVHPGNITGNSRLDNIWIRQGHGRGRWPATSGAIPWLFAYLDGLHGGGLIECETDAGAYQKGEFLPLTNDDFTRDYDLSGILEPHEQRKAAYVLTVDCVSGAVEKHIGVTGSDWLVLRLRRNGPSYSWAVIDAGEKSNNVDNSPVAPISYAFTGGVVRDCQIQTMGAAIPFLRVTTQNPNSGKPSPTIGQYTVTGNVVTSAGYSKWVQEEGANPGSLVGPNIVSGNLTSGLAAEAVPFVVEQYAYLPPLPPEPEPDPHLAQIAALEAQVAALQADLSLSLDQQDALAAWKATAKTLWASLSAHLEGP